MATTPDVPHFAYPLRLQGGAFALVDQDSQAEIEGCVEAILRCPRGWVDSDPAFGIPDLAFSQGGPDPAGVAELVRDYESRVDLATDLDLEGMAARLSLTAGRIGGASG